MNELFNSLMALCDDPENTSANFTYKDDVTGMGTKIRIFYYHIATYSQWLRPGALECRGIMFEMDENDMPVRIMCRPMEKFFNLGENPMTMNPNFEDALFYMTKEDGSLISSFIDKGVLSLKTKASVYSTQVYMAAQWLNEHYELKERVRELSENGYTVNFEYVGPNNQVVLLYEAPALRILNIRNTETGEYIDMSEIFADAVLRPHLVDIFDASDCANPTWVDDVRAMTGIEGYIIAFEDKMIKLKTSWYVNLHCMKDSITNNKHLVNCCIGNSTDDLRSLFVHDELSIKKIHDFETKYLEVMSDWFVKVESFYQANLHLDRKSYAVKSQVAFGQEPYLFHVSMNIYAGGMSVAVDSLTDIARRQVELLIPAKWK